VVRGARAVVAKVAARGEVMVEVRSEVELAAARAGRAARAAEKAVACSVAEVRSEVKMAAARAVRAVRVAARAAACSVVMRVVRRVARVARAVAVMAEAKADWTVAERAVMAVEVAKAMLEEDEGWVVAVIFLYPTNPNLSCLKRAPDKQTPVGPPDEAQGSGRQGGHSWHWRRQL